MEIISDWAGDELRVSMYEPEHGLPRIEVEAIAYRTDDNGVTRPASTILWFEPEQAREVAAALIARAVELESCKEADIAAQLAAHTAAACQIIGGGK